MSRFAEIVNSNHPFFKLPTEIRQIIYGMSQLNVSKDDIFTLGFGGPNLLFEGFGKHVSLLHVSRRFRQELLPIIFAERQACLLYRGPVTTSVPPGLILLSTDVLQMLSSMQLEFDVVIPKAIHGLNSMLTIRFHVRLHDDRYDVDIHVNNNWSKCDQTKLLEHLGMVLDQLDDSVQSLMGTTVVSEGEVSVHIVDDGRPITVTLLDLDTYNEIQAQSLAQDPHPNLDSAFSEIEL